jgi:hypothetical protein
MGNSYIQETVNKTVLMVKSWKVKLSAEISMLQLTPYWKQTLHLLKGHVQKYWKQTVGL